jgi:hypothetical protein
MQRPGGSDMRLRQASIRSGFSESDSRHIRKSEPMSGMRRIRKVSQQRIMNSESMSGVRRIRKVSQQRIRNSEPMSGLRRIRKSEPAADQEQ